MDAFWVPGSEPEGYWGDAVSPWVASASRTDQRSASDLRTRDDPGAQGEIGRLDPIVEKRDRGLPGVVLI